MLKSGEFKDVQYGALNPIVEGTGSEQYSKEGGDVNENNPRRSSLTRARSSGSIHSDIEEPPPIDLPTITRPVFWSRERVVAIVFWLMIIVFIVAIVVRLIYVET